MGSDSWRWWCAAAVLLSAAPAAGQRGQDVQASGLVLVRDSSVVAGSVGAAVRFGRGMRAGATLAAGWVAPRGVIGRMEVLVTYHLYPLRPAAAGWYLGAGVGGEVAHGRGRGLVLALLGAEVRPWRRGGMFAELGVGGGVRLAVGYRTIRLARRR